MAFMDRFKEAAEAARSTLEDPGTIGGEGAIRGRHLVAAEPDDVDVVRRMHRLGAPDPYSLVTRDEVVALTGIPVGGPKLAWSADDLGVRFDGEDGRGRLWSFGVHAGHAVEEGTSFDPAGWYRWMVALLDRAMPVDDLGENAVYESGVLYVRGGGRAFYVMVEAPAGSPSRKWATVIAARVLERFATGLAS